MRYLLLLFISTALACPGSPPIGDDDDTSDDDDDDDDDADSWSSAALVDWSGFYDVTCTDDSCTLTGSVEYSMAWYLNQACWADIEYEGDWIVGLGVVAGCETCTGAIAHRVTQVVRYPVKCVDPVNQPEVFQRAVALTSAETFEQMVGLSGLNPIESIRDVAPTFFATGRTFGESEAAFREGGYALGFVRVDDLSVLGRDVPQDAGSHWSYSAFLSTRGTTFSTEQRIRWRSLGSWEL